MSPFQATHDSGSRQRISRRPGTVLVLVVMLLMGLLAMAGLVIDVGVARLVQVQMQGAADLAATEGLRYRDAEPLELSVPPVDALYLQQVETVFGGPRPPKPATPYDENDPAWATWYQWLDAARRVAANRALGISFANHPDPFGGEVQHGAGPVLQLANPLQMDGVDFVTAGTIVTPDDGHAYKPDLLSDTSGLGFVTGEYGLNADFSLSHPEESRDEASDYERRDFIAASAAASSRAGAILVRLRRTADNPDPDGGALPMLFSPFNLRPADQPDAGLPVRGSAVAFAGDATFDATDPTDPKNYSVGRAKTAGPVVVDPQTNQVLLAGLAPFGLLLNQWNAFVQLNLQPNNLPKHKDLSVVGNSLVDPASGNVLWGLVRLDLGQIEVIGNTFESGNGSQSLQDAQATRDGRVYVPIYDDSQASGAGLRIVGFVYLSWDYSSPPTLRLESIQDQIVESGGVRVPRGKIGIGNVSATLALNLQTDAVDALFAIHNDRATFPSPLLVPVLVNRTIGPQF
jgi:hypothetical protein